LFLFFFNSVVHDAEIEKWLFENQCAKTASESIGLREKAKILLLCPGNAENNATILENDRLDEWMSGGPWTTKEFELFVPLRTGQSEHRRNTLILLTKYWVIDDDMTSIVSNFTKAESESKNCNVFIDGIVGKIYNRLNTVPDDFFSDDVDVDRALGGNHNQHAEYCFVHGHVAIKVPTGSKHSAHAVGQAVANRLGLVTQDLHVSSLCSTRKHNGILPVSRWHLVLSIAPTSWWRGYVGDTPHVPRRQYLVKTAHTLKHERHVGDAPRVPRWRKLRKIEFVTDKRGLKVADSGYVCGWDTGKVTDISYVFACVSNFDICYNCRITQQCV
jgi:hypothetical protein